MSTEMIVEAVNLHLHHGLSHCEANLRVTRILTTAVDSMSYVPFMMQDAPAAIKEFNNAVKEKLTADLVERGVDLTDNQYFSTK